MVVVALSLSTAASTARAGPNDLLAEGAEDRLWTAHVVLNVDKNLPGQRTIIRVRGAGESERWRQVAEIAAPAVTLTHRGGELVVLLQGGDWKFVADSGVRSGDRLPGNAPVRAIAGEGDDLWAIGLALHPSITTRGTTQPVTSAAATAQVETTPAPLALFRLERGTWTLVTTLPKLLPPNELIELTMTVIDGRPLLAGLLNDGSVRTVEFTRDRTWSERGTIKPQFDTKRIELLRFRGRPTLWAVGDRDAGVMYHLGDGWTGPFELRTETELGPGTDRALAVAFGRLRLLYAGGDGKLFEQHFGAEGVAESPPTQGAVQPLPPDPRVTRFVQFGVMVLLMFVMISTLRRRGSIQEAMRRADKLALAPVGLRFLAGVVDALPLVAVPAVVMYAAPTYEAAKLRMDDVVVQAWWFGALAFYLTHTTLCELLFARTLGKALFGLRIATLDGSRAGTGAILIRNVLRVVDLLLVLFPLIMIVLSPLRQRIGDVAAGTLVVRGNVINPPEPPPPGETKDE